MNPSEHDYSSVVVDLTIIDDDDTADDERQEDEQQESEKEQSEKEESEEDEEEADSFGDRRSISSGDSFELSALSHSRSLSRTSPLTAVPESSVSGVVSGTVLSNEARSAKGKRKRMPMASSSSEQEEKEGDGERCSICLDPWTSKGNHRICTLHCGHLFGKSCIERWLKERRSCPQCGGKVGARGSGRVIPLFLTNLVAKDTGELETARQQRDQEKRLRKQCEAERVRLSIQNESLKDQLSRLKLRQLQHDAQAKAIASSSSSSAAAAAAASPALTSLRDHQHTSNIGTKRPSPNPYSWKRDLIREPVVGTRSTPGRHPAPLFRLPDDTPNKTRLPPDNNNTTTTTTTQDSLSPSPSSSPRLTCATTVTTRQSGTAPPTSTLTPMPTPARTPSTSILRIDPLNVYFRVPVRDRDSRGGPTEHASAGPMAKTAITTSSRRLMAPAAGVTVGGASGSGRGVITEGGRRQRSAEGADDGVMSFSALMSEELTAGRVATFARGDSAALLVSQEFRRPGGRGGEASLRSLTTHGVTKFSLAELRCHKNIPLHKEQVRDVKFSGDAGAAGTGGYVLSTSFDKTLKVCDLRTDSVVIEYGLEGNGWSCRWSATDPSQMFCGIVDASRCAAVLLFDLRSTAGAVRKIRAAAGQRQPIHSICHLPGDQLVCATMGGVWAWRGGTKSVGGAGGAGSVKLGVEDAEEQAERLQIQAGACCSLSQHQAVASPPSAAAAAAAAFGVATSSSASNPSSSPPCFLVSTRGPSASHAVFTLGLPPPTWPRSSPLPTTVLPGAPQRPQHSREHNNTQDISSHGIVSDSYNTSSKNNNNVANTGRGETVKREQEEEETERQRTASGDSVDVEVLVGGHPAEAEESRIGGETSQSLGTGGSSSISSSGGGGGTSSRSNIEQTLLSRGGAGGILSRGGGALPRSGRIFSRGGGDGGIGYDRDDQPGGGNENMLSLSSCSSSAPYGLWTAGETRCSWADRWKRLPAVAQGHQSQHTLARSLLWEACPGGALLIAGGDERTCQPWIWDAATGEVCCRLPANRGPVLDVAVFSKNCSEQGLFAAVSQTEVRLYRTMITPC